MVSSYLCMAYGTHPSLLYWFPIINKCLFTIECLEGKCSCQLAPTPPKVLALGKMLNNETISINVSILASELLRKEQDSHLHETLRTYKMQLKWVLSAGGIYITMHRNGSTEYSNQIKCILYPVSCCT